LRTPFSFLLSTPAAHDHEGSRVTTRLLLEG
jgi:hypothetical protein